jgi:uncharacterized membrane protein
MNMRLPLACLLALGFIDFKFSLIMFKFCLLLIVYRFFDSASTNT